MIPYDQVEKKINNNIIEIAPIAFMRGRTLEDCFIILDEAQNTTKIQMKMFLTRLGKNSQMLIVGDTTQIDLKSKYSAIGMGILICQMSKFNRLILVENDFICLNFKYNDDFIGIIREVMPFVEHSVNLRIDRVIDYIYDGNLLIQEPINFAFLSNSNTILKSQELFFEKYNKHIYWIFWNMGDAIDHYIFEFDL